MPESHSHDASVALRQRIRDYLLDRLTGGQWRAGDQIPVEKDLMALFGASRMTVGGVLRELQAQGFVVRDQGRGTFVAEPRAHHSVVTIADPAEDIRRRGDAYSFTVQRRKRLKASPKQAGDLGLDPGSPIEALLLIHEANGEPEVIEDRIVNPALVPDFGSLNLAETSPFVHLMRRFPFPDSVHTIRAVGASTRTAKLLNIRSGAPCLEITRTTSVSRQRVTRVTLLYPGEKSLLTGRVERCAS